MDGLEIDRIHRTAVPSFGKDGFRGKVTSRKNVFDPITHGKVIETGKENVILRNVLVGDSGSEESQVKIAHFLPIDHMRVQIKSAMLYDCLDVGDGKLTVPTGIHVNNQRA